MFTIADGRDRLYQWDINVKLSLEDSSGSICGAHFKARFSRDLFFVPVTRTEAGAYVTVPNILLQQSYDISVYAYCGVDNCTKHVDVFTVEAKPRPADYMYTETEVLTYLTLDRRLSVLERTGGVTDEQLATAVSAYLSKNPVNGIPLGGKAGQFLCKQSDADGDVAWCDFKIPEQYGLVTYDQDKTITII